MSRNLMLEDGGPEKKKKHYVFWTFLHVIPNHSALISYHLSTVSFVAKAYNAPQRQKKKCTSHRPLLLC